MTVLPATAPATRIELRISGKPSGKDRPRFNSKTGRTYTPTKTVRAETDIRSVWREAGEPRLPDDAAVELHVTVVVTRPAGHWRKDCTLSAEGLRHPVPRTQKPDLDNAVKLVMDALNGRAYRDDVRVAYVTARRTWGNWPETLVELRTIAVTA